MISVNFESYNLFSGEVIFFTDRNGQGYQGVFKGNYTRTRAAFDFQNFNSGRTETIDIAYIQVLNRVDNKEAE